MAAAGSPTYFVSSEKLLGSSIYDGAGRKLGAIREIFLDPTSGRIAYLIGSSGGFLGVGAKFHPLPWARLSVRPGADGYHADFTKADLEGAPAYDQEQLASPQYAWAEQVDAYFQGVARHA